MTARRPRSQVFWAVSDQALVSLGNFGLTILLARALSPQDYGRYVLILGLMLIVGTMQASLLVYPMTVKCASAAESDVPALTSAFLVLTTAMAPVVAAVMLIAGSPVAGMGLSAMALAAALAGQVQEITRAVFRARLQHRLAIRGDVIRYVGPLAALFVARSAIDLTAELAFLAIAVLSLVAALVQVVQLRLPWPNPRIIWSLPRECWRIGCWSLPAVTLSAGTLQAFPWCLGTLHGPALAASYQALMNAVAMANPVMFSVGNLITPATAAHLAGKGIRAAVVDARNYAFLGAALVLPYFIVLMSFPDVVLRVLYGSGSSYLEFAASARLMAFGGLTYYFAHVAGSFLTGMQLAHLSFRAEAIAGIAAAAAIVVLIPTGGVPGAVVAFTCFTFTRAAAQGLFTRSVVTRGSSDNFGAPVQVSSGT